MVLRARWRVPRAAFAARAERLGRSGRAQERHAGLEGRDGGLDARWFAGAIVWSAPREAATPAAPFAITCKESSIPSCSARAFDSATAPAHQPTRSRFFSAHQTLRGHGNRPRRRPRHRLAGARDADAADTNPTRQRGSCGRSHDNANNSAESCPGHQTIHCSQRNSRRRPDSADLEAAGSNYPASGRNSCRRRAGRAIAGGSSVHRHYIDPSGRRSEQIA